MEEVEVVYEIVFSTLLDKLGIKRAQYVEACLKYQDTDYSISDIIGIIRGKSHLGDTTIEIMTITMIIRLGLLRMLMKYMAAGSGMHR